MPPAAQEVASIRTTPELSSAKSWAKVASDSLGIGLGVTSGDDGVGALSGWPVCGRLWARLTMNPTAPALDATTTAATPKAMRFRRRGRRRRGCPGPSDLLDPPTTGSVS